MPVALLILLIPLLAGAGYAAFRRLKKGGGCCGEHESAVVQSGPRDRNRAHYPYQITLKIGGMTCENCARRVENALNALDGVWARVRVDDAAARILCKQPPDEDALRRAVRGAGYVALEKIN